MTIIPLRIWLSSEAIVSARAAVIDTLDLLSSEPARTLCVCSQGGKFFLKTWIRFLKEPENSDEILENTDYLMVFNMLLNWSFCHAWFRRTVVLNQFVHCLPTLMRLLLERSQVPAISKTVLNNGIFRSESILPIIFEIAFYIKTINLWTLWHDLLEENLAGEIWQLKFHFWVPSTSSCIFV